jgi:hypothetical protein
MIISISLEKKMKVSNNLKKLSKIEEIKVVTDALTLLLKLSESNEYNMINFKFDSFSTDGKCDKNQLSQLLQEIVNEEITHSFFVPSLEIFNIDSFWEGAAGGNKESKSIDYFGFLDEMIISLQKILEEYKRWATSSQ